MSDESGIGDGDDNGETEVMKDEYELQPLTGTIRNGQSRLNVDNADMDIDTEVTELENVLYEEEKVAISSQYDDGTFQTRLENWLYPPHLPRSCQLLRRENIAVPACYLLVGILQGLIGPLTNVYPLDLGATEAQQTVLSNIRSLPATFKLIFGFVSDNFPICGYRRKSYMLFGWSVAAASMVSLIFFSDLSMQRDEETDEDGATVIVRTAPEGAPSIPFLSLSLLLFGTGFWIADVMGDSVVAEKAKLEPDHSRGSIQSSCYSYRFFGLMCAAPFSSGLYSFYGPYYVIGLLSMLPLAILPLVYFLGEQRYAFVPSTSDQCKEIWNTVQSRAVWQPLAFVYIFNVLQVSNSAWREFLKTTLGFTPSQLNAIYIAAVVLLYLGILAYKYFFIKYSWRMVYIITTLVNGIFSALQVLLILGMTFGISNFWFALGDDAFQEFIQGIQFLPTTIMMVHLCPAGSEGASYAMFTTVHNSALNLSSALSTKLLPIWDVSKEALANHELSGMVNLTLLTTFLQVIGIVFVCCLPPTKEALFRLKETHSCCDVYFGILFLVVTFCSIGYAIFIGVMNIISPGWMGES